MNEASVGRFRRHSMLSKNLSMALLDNSVEEVVDEILAHIHDVHMKVKDLVAIFNRIKLSIELYVSLLKRIIFEW